MGDHVDNRKSAKRSKRQQRNESVDVNARHQRISFKNYLRSLEEELLEDDLDQDDLDEDGN